MSKEEFLRKIWGEEEINKENSSYPTSTQRPKIYEAIKAYAEYMDCLVSELQKENEELKNEVESLRGTLNNYSDLMNRMRF